MQPAPLHQKFGRYELLTLLARGGMAEVFLARITGVGGFAKLLVIKRILPHLTGDPEFVEMFLNEGRIAARLSHPNVCQVFELGEVDGDLFLAMEYLDGLVWADLIPLVPRGDGFELRCAAAVIGQICEGLRYAHELCDVHGTPTPVVHRDVSPQNLMITTDGICKLLDFGVSKVLTEGSRTRTGMLKGKLPYMAPEQIRGERVDPRADVFSMGVVLWESLTGERLFNRDSDYLIWRAITEDDIPPVTAKQPTLPPAIDAVVARALERDPAQRYPSIGAFATELRQVADLLGGPLPSAALADVVRSLAGPELAERAQRVSRAVKSPERESPLGGGSALTLTDVQPVIEPSTTKPSIALRDESVRLGRRPDARARRAASLAAIAVVLGLGVAAAWWARGGGEPADAALRGIASDASVAATSVDAATVDAAPPVDDELASDEQLIELDPGPRDPPRPARRRPSHAESEPGLYSVDSSPYATIFIDGKSYGATPLFKVPLSPGRHHVRAVRGDGRSKRLTITIAPGKLVTSGTLAW